MVGIAIQLVQRSFFVAVGCPHDCVLQLLSLGLAEFVLRSLLERHLVHPNSIELLERNGWFVLHEIFRVSGTFHHIVVLWYFLGLIWYIPREMQRLLSGSRGPPRSIALLDQHAPHILLACYIQK